MNKKVQILIFICVIVMFFTIEFMTYQVNILKNENNKLKAENKELIKVTYSLTENKNDNKCTDTIREIVKRAKEAHKESNNN